MIWSLKFNLGEYNLGKFSLGEYSLGKLGLAKMGLVNWDPATSEPDRWRACLPVWVVTTVRDVSQASRLSKRL